MAFDYTIGGINHYSSSGLHGPEPGSSQYPYDETQNEAIKNLNPNTTLVSIDYEGHEHHPCQH